MKTIVMTGATHGLGAAAARQLAAQGHRMLLIARDKTRGEAMIATLTHDDDDDNGHAVQHTLYVADMASLSDLKRVAQEIHRDESSIDVLINNAGAMSRDRHATPDGIERTIAVNHLAYVVLTLELADLLLPGSRVVNTAGLEHRQTKWDGDDLLMEKHSSAGFPVYWRTKLYNILFTRELARRWAGRNVTVNCLHPGMTATNFGAGELGFLEPVVKFALRCYAGTAEAAGQRITYLATSKDVEGVSGKYFAKNREAEPSEDARNDEFAKVLWERSLEWARMN